MNRRRRPFEDRHGGPLALTVASCAAEIDALVRPCAAGARRWSRRRRLRALALLRVTEHYLPMLRSALEDAPVELPRRGRRT